MSLRFLLSAALLFTCCSASVSQAEQEGYNPKKRIHHYRGVRRHGLPPAFGRVDLSDVFTPYIYYNCPHDGCQYSTAPYFSNQTFWERVQSQPDYPVR